MQYQGYEIMEKNHLDAIIKQCLGCPASLITGSKGQYCYDNPRNLTIFNANVCIASLGPVWHGDLDLTLSYQKINELAKKLGENVYVFHESWPSISNPLEFEKNFIYKVNPQGQMELCLGFSFKHRKYSFVINPNQNL